MLDYALVKIAVYAELEDAEGGVTQLLDIIGFNSSFAVNTIPAASLAVAVGKLANHLGLLPEAASIHKIQSILSNRPKIRVYLNSKVLSSLGVQRNAGAVSTTSPLEAIGVPSNNPSLLIFEGNVTGVGRGTSTSGTATAVLHIEHWLANLNYASALSATSHPGNPGDLVFSAVLRTRGVDPKAAGQTTASVTWVPAAADVIVNTAALSDLWGNTLHKWMIAVTNEDPFVIEANTAANDTAPILDALERMRPGNPAGVPLAVDNNMGADTTPVLEGISQSLTAKTGNNWVNTTLWGKLVGEWAPEYKFSVIPRVSDALVVPFSGPLSGRAWAVVGREDYLYAKIDSHIPQMLRGVGIVRPTQSATGFNQSETFFDIANTGFAGQYISPAVKTGMIRIKDAPGWLSNVVLASRYSGEAEGVRGVVQTPLEGEGEVADNQGATAVQQLRDRTRTMRTFLDNYAHQEYAMERLRSRVGEVSGKLRFDICPGSNVRIEADTADDDPTAAFQESYATVVQVSYFFDAEGQKAGTAYMLDHVHTAAEHFVADNDLVVDKPPLYATGWKGATMMAGIQPEQDTGQTDIVDVVQPPGVVA